MQGRKTTGVTLQTLHPEHFDQGAIVAQRPFNIPNEGACTFKELYNHSAEVAADLLIESLLNQSYLHPQPQPTASKDHLTHARKVTPEDAHVDWHQWPAARILRTQRALGQVWSHHEVSNGKLIRVQWHGFRPLNQTVGVGQEVKPGQPLLTSSAAAAAQESRATEASVKNDDLAAIPTCDGRYLAIDSVTIEGRKKHEAAVKGVQMLLDGSMR